MARRGGRRGRSRRSRTARGRRASNRARARSRAQASARARRATSTSRARTASAQRSRNRAAARARAQAAARARNAAKAKAASQRKARTAAAQRARNQAAARQRAQDAARQRAQQREQQQQRSQSSRQSTPRRTFDRQLQKIQTVNKSFGPVRDGREYARNINNYNMMYGKTPAIRAKAYENTLNPKSFRGLSDGQTFGVGPVASGDAYARGMAVDNQSVENRLRQLRNFGSTMTMGLISPVRKLSAKEIADRRTILAAQRDARFMGRRTGGKGGTTRVQQQAEEALLFPETAATVGQPITDTGTLAEGTNFGGLSRIQGQAYNTAIGDNLSGMFAGMSPTGMVGPGGTTMAISPELRAGESRGQRRLRLFRARRRDGGTGDQFSRAGERIGRLTNLNI